MEYMDSVTERVGGMYKMVDLVRLPDDKREWIFMIANVARQAPR